MSRFEDRQNSKYLGKTRTVRLGDTRAATTGISSAHNASRGSVTTHGASEAGVLASLDLGASKIACFIVRPEGIRASDQTIRAAGVGLVQSRGIRSGAIIDMEAASTAIGQAVERAEAMANVSISAVRVCVPGAQTATHTVTTQVSLGTRPLSDQDLNRAIASALAQARYANRRVIHLLPIHWSVDEQTEVRDPRGLTGRVLGLKLLVVSIDESVFNNIVACVNQAHLEVAAIVSAPFASAVSVLEDDEIKLGAIVIDMGASSTTISVFRGGNLVHVDCLNVGGSHVTQDLARGISTTLAGAERIKTLYGSAIASSFEDREMIDAPPRGDDAGAAPISVPRSILKGIIAPRIEETFELLRERLKAAHVTLEPGAGIVLAGGAAQLAGVREVAIRVFDRPARIGKPKRVQHLGEAVAGPAFAAVTGVILRTLYGPRDVVPVKKIMTARIGPKDAPQSVTGGPVMRAINWLRTHL